MTHEPRSGSGLPSRVVAVGASAGGVGALVDLVGAFPGDLDAAVFVVLHLSPTAHSALPEILGRHAKLMVHGALDGEPVEARHVYVAPPDLHLTVEPANVSVRLGPSESGHRPSVDALFRSAARSWGARAIGVVLSGALDDGAAGLVAIHRAGGAALAQDPAEAAVADMPRHAIGTGVVDDVLGVEALAYRIVDLVSEPPPPDHPRRVPIEAAERGADAARASFGDERSAR